MSRCVSLFRNTRRFRTREPFSHDNEDVCARPIVLCITSDYVNSTAYNISRDTNRSNARKETIDFYRKRFIRSGQRRISRGMRVVWIPRATFCKIFNERGTTQNRLRGAKVAFSGFLLRTTTTHYKTRFLLTKTTYTCEKIEIIRVMVKRKDTYY